MESEKYEESGVRPPKTDLATFAYAYRKLPDFNAAGLDTIVAKQLTGIYDDNGVCWVEVETPEYSAINPQTGLPDYGVLTIRYRPDQKILDLPAFKNHLHSFRNVGIFYEHAANLIARDIWVSVEPRVLSVDLKTMLQDSGMIRRINVTLER